MPRWATARAFAATATPSCRWTKLATCAIDISGRPYCAFTADLPPGTIAGFDHEETEEFFRAVASAASSRFTCASMPGRTPTT